MVFSRCLSYLLIHLDIILRIKINGSKIASVITIQWYFKFVLYALKMTKSSHKNVHVCAINTVLTSNSHNFVKNQNILMLQKRKHIIKEFTTNYYYSTENLINQGYSIPGLLEFIELL